NEPYENYVVQFGQFWFDFFEGLGLYDVYHSVWFLAILLFLLISTSLCIYRNSPLMIKELRAFREQATEKSLRHFSLRQEYASDDGMEAIKARLGQFLSARSFRYKTVVHKDGSELFAAKAGSYQRLGYIFTHAAIVVICVGGLLDGNVPFKVQELLGYKKIETLDIPASQVPAVSHMPVNNLSFRANMTLPEGSNSDVAFMRVRDGYLVQELPFSIGLKDFRIKHYATGQPKSFESDVVILDPERKEPLSHTISVNHPLIYKGIAIYQSDFQDGGSKLNFDAWDLLDAKAVPTPLDGTVFKNAKMGQGADALTVEFDNFRLFNIVNLSPNGKGRSHNVGPNVTFKVRNAQGQANEYVNYMQPLKLDGRLYFVSGMRSTQQDDFKYLRIPADEDNSLQGFMHFRAVMFDESAYAEIARRLAAGVMADSAADKQLKQKFETSIVRLLKAFASGGYTHIAKLIETSVPAAEREKAAQTYIRIINGAAFEAYAIGRARAGQPPPKEDEETLTFLQDSLNAMSDIFLYGSPFYLQLSHFDQKQASGLQLTRSPGKSLVYSGSVLLVLGIFCMIFIRERRIWLLVKPEDNESGTRVLFAMSANRKNRDTELEFARYQEQLQRLMQA
ncbi:MAG TPA: cytochrome c biogenesis protein ResB, partial [Methylophilaceae bacterium]|nr:cytochrome c biogenesis protein ResB [Methylophilaceae bacterium]